MSTPFDTTLPSGDVMNLGRILRACLLTVDGRELLTELIVLDMDEYEIILSMDWLSKYNAL